MPTDEHDSLLVTVVEDDRLLREMLQQVITVWGFRVQTASSGEEGLEVLCLRPAPILLTDLVMPGKGGVWLVREVRKRFPETIALVLTGQHESEPAIECLNAGALRYLLKPPCLHDLRNALNVAAELVNLRRERASYQEDLERTVRRQTQRIRRLSLSGIKSLNIALEARDPYTSGHSQRVRRYSLALGKALGLERRTLRKLALAACLHDIGKVAIAESILNKPGRLTVDEHRTIQRHPVLGEKILRPIIRNREVLGAIRGHHERMDGKGYPDGLSGEQIPLLARIISVADCFDAVTTIRPYRGALSLSETAALLNELAGSQLDPHIVAAWLKLIKGAVDAAPGPREAFREALTAPTGRP